MPKLGELLVSVNKRILHRPSDLGRAFRTRVERASIGLGEMIRARHQTLILRAVRHREHVTCFVDRYLERPGQEQFLRDRLSHFLVETPERPYADSILKARLTKDEVPCVSRKKIMIREADECGRIGRDHLRQ